MDIFEKYASSSAEPAEAGITVERVEFSVAVQLVLAAVREVVDADQFAEIKLETQNSLAMKGWQPQAFLATFGEVIHDFISPVQKRKAFWDSFAAKLDALDLT